MASSRKYTPIEGYKSSKTELIAIYRLEFYKNKKNWKLCPVDVKKEPPQSPSPKCQSKSLMNQTYNIEEGIEEPVELEQVSPHNQAFLHEEPADDATDIEAAPDPQVYVPPEPTPHNLCWPEDKSDAIWQDAQQEWCGAESEGGMDEPAGLVGGACPQPTWPPVNQVNNPTYEQLEYLSPAELVQLAEEWLLSHGYPLHQEEYAPYYEQYGLLDDSADFMRGAHGVPHSSEIDLSISHECPALGRCAGARWLSALSGRALRAAAHAHAAALRALLAEDALRENISLTPTTLNLPMPFEEYPTRDTDPPRPPDLLLSASHRPPDVGRGRGRLRPASDRLIGIGMGRPYRL